MSDWSARTALRSAPLGLIPLAVLGLGVAIASSPGSDDDAEAVAIVTGLVLCGVASAVIGWLRPNSFPGAAIGAGLVLLAIMLMFRTTKWPFGESAAFAGYLAASELVGIASKAAIVRVRKWGRA